MSQVITAGLLEEDISVILGYQYMDPKAIKYELIIHTLDEDIVVDYLATVEILRDFRNNFADQILVTFLMGMGDFVKGIIPNTDNAEASLILRYYDKPVLVRYKFVLSNNIGGVNGSMYSTMGREALNELEQVKVEAQLVHTVVEGMRGIVVDGVYSYTTVQSVIKGVMLEAMSSITIGGEEPIVNFNFIPPNNEKEYRHIQIPTGTRLVDLPNYIQNTDYGVYNTGIGAYFMPYCLTSDDADAVDTLFVYPLYHPEQTENQVKKLVILSSPTNMYANIDNTFIVDGDTIKIIGAGNVKNFDSGDNALIDSGSAFISTDPNALVDGGILVTDLEAGNSGLVNLSGHNTMDKRDGVHDATYVNSTDNTYKHYSEFAAKQMSLYQVEWKHCNHELLYPGMPVTYMYEDTELGLVELTGVLQSVFIRHDTTHGTTTSLLNALLSNPARKPLDSY